MADEREDRARAERDSADREEQSLATQASLEEALARYTDLYDSAPVPYVTLTSAGLIEEMNLPAAQLLQIDRSRYAHMPFRQFVDDADKRRFRDHLHQCSKQRGPVKTELTVRTQEGRQIPVELSSGNGHLGKSGYVYSTAMLSLVERRQAAAEREELILREQQAKVSSDTKDRFVAVLSHELRNPLTPVMAALTILNQEPLSERARRVLAVMRRNLDLEVRLIDDLLDMTRISTGKLKLLKREVDVDTVIHEVLDMIADDAAAKSLRLETALLAPRHVAFVDPARLRQILWNLFRNALKFTHEGSISVRTRNRMEEGNGGTIIIEVKDTGIGIPEDQREGLFEPLAQVSNVETSRAGLGLGLAISKGLVESHGGRIWARSEGLGKGSTFSFELPVQEAREEKPEKEDWGEKKEAGRLLSILIAEDQQDTADLMAQLLEDKGHQVKVAGSVRAALDLYREWRADLFIGDIGLPDGSGLDLMRELQLIQPVPGIAISGYGTKHDVERSIEAGFKEHMTKPVDFEGLLEAIERADDGRYAQP